MKCCICGLEIPRDCAVDALDPYTGNPSKACETCFSDATIQAEAAYVTACGTYFNR